MKKPNETIKRLFRIFLNILGAILSLVLIYNYLPWLFYFMTHADDIVSNLSVLVIIVLIISSPLFVYHSFKEKNKIIDRLQQEVWRQKSYIDDIEKHFKKTQLENFIALYHDFGIDLQPVTSNATTTITIDTNLNKGSLKIDGIKELYTEIQFDSDGNFLEQGLWMYEESNPTVNP